MIGGLSERDQRVIWHPYTHQKTMATPLALVRGEGALLFDEAGKSYIDATSSWWVNIHGHAHPYIAERIYRQALALEHVIFAGYTHGPAVELAERLLPMLPGNFSRLFYSDNGSTAVEVALKMCIQYWKNKGMRRPRLLALHHSYHGDTFGAMGVSERSVYTLAFQDYLFEVTFLDLSDPETAVGQIRDLGHETAAFIYEPLLQGAGGMRVYEASALEALLKACKAEGVLCIADEVMTGFGRTGPAFASEQVPTRPDVICLSKGLTGGAMALGATACANEIYQAFVDDDKYKTLFHGHSFTANPLACTAALASLDLFVDPACAANRERIHRKHCAFAAELREQAMHHGPAATSAHTDPATGDRKTDRPPAAHVHDVHDLRVLGTMLAFEIETNAASGYLNAIGPVLAANALRQGVMLRPMGDTLYLLPPYCITDAQLDRAYDCIRSALILR